MVDEETTVVPEEEAAPQAEAAVILEGNCGGELVMLPDVEGTTYHEYTCQECGQVVHVGLEHLELYGLPTQHHKHEEENS